MRANLASFDRADRSVAKYETRLQGLNRKLELQTRIVEESRTEYERMVREYGEGSREAETAARAYNNQVASLRNLERSIARTSQELADIREEQNRTVSGWERFSGAAERAGTTLSGVGEKLKGVGESMTASLTLPLIGFGALAGKVANDFDAAAGIIQTELGISAEKAENLEKTANNLWKNGFGEDLATVSEKVAGVTKALGDLSEVDLSYVTKGLDLFEKRGWGDQEEALRAAKILMEQFGITAQQAMDYLTKGFQENLNYSGEFLDSVSEYSTYYSELGFSADEMFSKLKSGAESGAFQIDKVGDALKEFSLRAKDGSKTSTEAFQSLNLDAGKMTAEFNKGGSAAQEAFKKVVSALKNTKDETVQNTASVNLFGTQYEDLGEKAFAAMLEATTGMDNVAGATQRASDALQDNLGAKAQKVWRNFLTDLKPVGEILVDLAENALPKVADTIGKVTGAFADLSPEGQKTVLLIGGIAAAIGPLVTGLGFASIGISGLIGGLTLLTGPVGLTVLGIAGLGAGFLALDNAMDKPIIKADIFAGKISESTQKAVGSYMKLDSDATAELNNLQWSQKTITDKMAEDMIGTYDRMYNTILTNMQTNHQKQLEELQNLFNQSDILTEEEEAKRVAKAKAKQLEEEKNLSENQQKIRDIWQKAADEKRGITENEATQIAYLQSTMKIKAVEELSKSQEEQLTILRNMKENKGIIETEEAANTVAKSIDTRDKVVKEANKAYNERVSWATMARDDLGILSAEEAQKIIDEAERSKNETVAKAEDTHIEVVKHARQQSGEHVSEVNWETGEVLSGWDSMYNGVISAVNWIRDLFGKGPLKKKGTVQENGRQQQKRQNASFAPGYAIGTPSTGHPGGPAIVGEEGIELANIPNQGITLLGTNGPEFINNLPRGSSVLPNKHTERLLKSYGFPGYADGIGDYFDIFLKGAGNVWDMVKNKFSLKDSLIPSWLNNHTGSPLTYIGEMATSWIKDTWDNWFGDIGRASGGSGVQQWTGIATKALMMTGQYTKSNLDKLLFQMKTESGGNPRAINLWDINAKRGTPSKGLMQVIDPTFKAYSMPGYNKDIWDPLSNILASIRYAVSRYGSLTKAYRGVGYETGGLIEEDGLYRLAEGGYPEFVIPTDPARRTDAMKLLALAGRQIEGNKRPNQLPNVSSNSQDSSIMKQLLDATLQQNQILMQLLRKDNSLIVDGRELGRTVSPHVKEFIGFNNNRFEGRAY